MSNNSIKTLIFSLICFTSTAVSTGFWQQANPEILKRVKVDSPSQAEQALMEACSALHQCDMTTPALSAELFNTMKSVSLFSDILPQYNQAATVVGFLGLVKQTAEFTDNVEAITKKQAILRAFENDQAAAQKLTTAFNASVAGERVYWKTYAVNKATAEREKCNPLPPLTKKIINFFAESGIRTEIARRSIQSFIAGIPAGGYYATTIFTKIYNKEYVSQSDQLKAAYGATYTFLLPLFLMEEKKVWDNIFELQKELMALAQLLKAMQETQQILAESPLKSMLAQECATLMELFDSSSSKTSSDLKNLVSELFSYSFQGEPSYYLSRQGKIIATYQLLCRINQELLPYLQAFGHIEGHLAIFKLYKKFENHPNATFCLPTFVKSTTPDLNARSFWHPLINPDIVIGNDLHMGQKTANLIITGPNAGGKTTSLMALIINIIFAQSFGIAPSKSFAFTPFAKIHSYLDITTCIQEGLSLFAAEVDRATKLKNSIMSCKADQKTFTIIDEMFSGTNPAVASEVGLKFAKKLAEFSHSMTIITTHFPRLTDLEKETNNFKNYKVADATILDSGKISYPFKLVPGISSQNIAEYMLQAADII